MTLDKKWNHLDILESPTDNNFAVVILNQPIFTKPNLVVSLWKNASLRIVVDGGSNRWLEFIERNDLKELIRPDYVTGDFDSLSEKTEKYLKELGVEFVSTPDQDETDYTKALRHVRSVAEERKLKLDLVISLCETSGRLDQIMANLETLHHSLNIFPEDVPLLQLCSNSVTWLLTKGNHEILVRKRFVDEKYWCGLIPLRGSTSVTTNGLKWNLDNGILAFGELVSTSNTFSEVVIRVSCDKDIVWTMQYCSAE